MQFLNINFPLIFGLASATQARNAVASVSFYSLLPAAACAFAPHTRFQPPRRGKPQLGWQQIICCRLYLSIFFFASLAALLFFHPTPNCPPLLWQHVSPKCWLPIRARCVLLRRCLCRVIEMTNQTVGLPENRYIIMTFPTAPSLTCLFNY